MITSTNKQDNNMEKYFIRASAANFIKIPGSPVAYWATEKVFDIFQDADRLSKTHMPRQGLATTDNARFVRFWHEISLSQIGYQAVSKTECNT